MRAAGNGGVPRPVVRASSPAADYPARVRGETQGTRVEATAPARLAAGALRRRLLLPGLLVACAALALDVDPYLRGRSGGALFLPTRLEVGAASALTAALALWTFFCPARRGRWGAAALVSAAFTLLVGCPATRASVHGLQLALLAAALCAWIAGLERARSTGRLGIRCGLLALVALAVEGAFTPIARSHAVGYTLAARQWFSRYWGRPANHLGYRDVEPGDDGRPRIFVLGDSFVAGVGIADARERFSDRLRELLPRYQVHNLGWNGADTRNEYERLAACPLRPAVVVLSYYVNDIAGAAEALGHRVPPFTPYRDVPRAVRWLVARSYALDFLYWLAPHDDLAWQGSALAQAYTRPEVVEAHEADLQRIVDWTREKDCRLVVVLFPDLTRVAESGPWLAPAERVCARNGVPTLDVRELVRGRPVAETTVNRNDAHPSVWLHGEVARALAERIVALDPGKPANQSEHGSPASR